MKNLLTLMLLLLFAIAEAQDNEGEYESFDHSKFGDNSAEITNDWMPLTPGMRYLYSGITLNDEEEETVPHRVIIYVTDLTKVIDGVKARVTWDLDYSAGVLVEEELAFYAQDKEGTIWRMGEYPVEYDEEGEFDAAPCWMAGIQKAKAGISMLANPWADTPDYSQGWGPAVEFTDRGQVDKMGLRQCVPMGCYSNVMVIAETSADEVGIYQLKYFAQGVGNIMVGHRGPDPSAERLELVDILQLTPDAIEEVRQKALELEKNGYKRSKKVYGKTAPCVADTEK